MILSNFYILGGLLLALYLIAGLGFLLFTHNSILYIFYLELMYLIIIFSIVLLCYFLNFHLLYVVLLALVVATIENCILILILVVIKYKWALVVNTDKTQNISQKLNVNIYFYVSSVNIIDVLINYFNDYSTTDWLLIIVTDVLCLPLFIVLFWGIRFFWVIFFILVIDIVDSILDGLAVILLCSLGKYLYLEVHFLSISLVKIFSYSYFSDFLLLYILTILPILLAVAYVILWERKLMASVQRRRGPNVVGIYGVLQPLIDAVKLLAKEVIIPDKVNQFVFVMSPVITIVVALTLWTFLPFTNNNFYYDYEYGLLMFLGVSSLGPYGIVLAGWSSNSSYAVLGSLRSVAQFISYEVILTFLLLPIIMYTESLNFIEIVTFQRDFSWFIFPLFPFFVWFLIAVLAETNRTPFDLPEAEAELVAGYNTEYAGVFFIMFMLAEYSNLLCMSVFISLLFLGGWHWDLIMFILHDMTFYLFVNFDTLFFIQEGFLAFKTVLLVAFFIIIRASLPRFRFDQLMTYCWCNLLPLSFGMFFITIFIYILQINMTWFV